MTALSDLIARLKAAKHGFVLIKGRCLGIREYEKLCKELEKSKQRAALKAREAER